MNGKELALVLYQARYRLDKAFSAKTAYGNWDPKRPSKGHCAAVAWLMRHQLRCGMLSTTVDGESHWFNAIVLDDGSLVEFDLTGDQFNGRSSIQIGQKIYELYSKIRYDHEVNQETRDRAAILLSRMNIQ